MKPINVGDEVLVALPADVKALYIRGKNIERYDGQTMRVTKRSKPKNSVRCYFELEGAVSDKYGVPFTFLRDWLIKL